MEENVYKLKLPQENKMGIRKIQIKEWKAKDGLPPNARRGNISHVTYISDENGHRLLDPTAGVPVRFYGRASEGLNAVVEAKAQAEDYLRKNSEWIKEINSF
jgi:acetylornithine/succinyldiaminopimelate/putrescine aminotransferase